MAGAWKGMGARLGCGWWFEESATVRCCPSVDKGASGCGVQVMAGQRKRVTLHLAQSQGRSLLLRA